MTECYWEKPLKSKTGTTERGSKKYRDYYFKHDGNITTKQIAKHFNKSESAINTYKYVYEWDSALSDKHNYESRKKAEALKEKAIDYFEKTYNNANELINLKFTLYLACAIVLGWIPNRQQLPIPSDLTKEKALDILSKVPIEQLNKMIIRSLGEPYTLNDTQKFEGEIMEHRIVQSNKSKEELDQEYEDRFKEYLQNITTDSGTDV